MSSLPVPRGRGGPCRRTSLPRSPKLASKPSVEDVLARAEERMRTTGSRVSIDDILSARVADSR